MTLNRRGDPWCQLDLPCFDCKRCRKKCVITEDAAPHVWRLVYESARVSNTDNGHVAADFVKRRVWCWLGGVTGEHIWESATLFALTRAEVLEEKSLSGWDLRKQPQEQDTGTQAQYKRVPVIPPISRLQMSNIRNHFYVTADWH